MDKNEVKQKKKGLQGEDMPVKKPSGKLAGYKAWEKNKKRILRAQPGQQPALSFKEFRMRKIFHIRLSGKARQSFRFRPALARFFKISAAALWLAGIACSSQNKDNFSASEREVIQVETLLKSYPEVKESFVHNYLEGLSQTIKMASGTRVEIKVLSASKPFAYSTASGVIIISKALVMRLTNEAELFFVLSHETAHITLKHSSEAGREVKVWNGEEQAEHKLESEADRFAMYLLLRCGYNPGAALSALAKAYGRSNGSEPKNESHPALEERISAAQKLALKMMVPFSITDRRDFQVFKAELRRI